MNQSIRFVSLAFALVVAAFSLSSTASAETGTLRVTFKYKGTPPAAGKLDPTNDKAFCGKKDIPDESLIVNKENNGLKNVMVYVYTGRGGTKLPEMELEPTVHELANKDCRFDPHIVIAKVGDTVRVTNPDQVGHNANFAFFKNEGQNPTVPAGGSVDIMLKETEPAPIPVSCNIHNWMQARLLVLDHPFAGVSDANGVLEIKGLPVGEITFRANHETGSMTEVFVDGEETDWKRARFEIDIKAGMNDLGVVEIPADAFN
ncbi:MAG: methylamine utilization protein [Planctomycetota bacterium]